jgi:hypothetical protein
MTLSQTMGAIRIILRSFDCAGYIEPATGDGSLRLDMDSSKIWADGR